MRQLVFIFLFLFVSACATVQEPTVEVGTTVTNEDAWDVHRQQLEDLITWSLKGRVAGKSNEEGFRAGVHWQQQQQDFEIELLDPLGRKVAIIDGDAQQVQLNTSKGEQLEAQDAESLMQGLLGYSLPVNGLRYWLRGIPNPELVYASLELDEQGRLKQLDQAGWLIDYQRYHNGAPSLPAFIKVSNPTLQAKIIIHRWELPE